MEELEELISPRAMGVDYQTNRMVLTGDSEQKALNLWFVILL